MQNENKEIIKALTIIKNVCDDSVCEDCLFSDNHGICLVTGDSPNVWKINNTSKLLLD